MAIACAYCGESHPTPAQVRECWQRHQGVEAAVGPHDVLGAAIDKRVRQPWLNPGPEALARGIVIAAGANVPTPWAAAQRVVVDRSVLIDPAQTVAMLQVLAAAGRRAVIEVAANVLDEIRQPPRSVDPAPPYSLGPRFWFPLDVLHHLVWSNAIDATAAEPSWQLVDSAIRLGAAPAPAGTEDSGDVQLSDGSLVWLDGGPIRRRGAIGGVPVLHAVSVEHGSLLAPVEREPAAELAPDQRAAVTHVGAAARIIAPAGSGKTRVLTERARHLLDGWRVPPGALSLVAFNKRAQLEIQSRTTDLRGLRVRTLNAIALAIVNGHAPFAAQSRSWRTIDEVDVRRVIGTLVSFPRKRNTDPVAAWIEALSVVRLGLRTPDDVESMYNGDVDGLAEMWPRYRARLERDGALDFDDQIYRAIELLLTDPDARFAAQRACRFLLVDEFQDLTPAHILLVRLLSAPGFGVFGVGDDDQTIYGYSGANPEWLIDFASLFPDAGVHPLEVNYRCPGDVVVAADRLVRHNRRRVAKVIRGASPKSTGLHVVTCTAAGSDTLTETVDIVRKALQKGRQPSDVAVLTRVNALLAPVQVGLLAHGIRVQGGVGTEFLERTAIRASLAWLRLAVAGPESLPSQDLAEALRRPSRPMHPNVANWVAEQHSIAGLRRLAGRITTERDAVRVAAFTDDLTRLQRMATISTTAEILGSLADDVGLGAAIATLDDGRHGMNRAAQNDDLVAMAQLAALHPDPASFGDWLRIQLTERRSDDGVVLSTVHRVKGQEWPVVVVHHAEADQYPHRLAEDLEEERRVFHVAITRGSEHVHVVVGSDPSPFLEDMGREPPERLADDRTVTVRATRGGSSTMASSAPTRNKPAGRETMFDKVTVLAAPGLVIVDGGQEWTIESVEADSAVARRGGVTRRFSFGSSVVTAGRQRGPLRTTANDVPSAPSIRAHDKLRQTRERLRSGKPAYVVFDDKTLEAIALALPSTIRALGAIPGIGPAKLEQYGDAILLAVEDASDHG
jgi:DNA helicase-2/ATP-dependent DNA helicase PcrA